VTQDRVALRRGARPVVGRQRLHAWPRSHRVTQEAFSPTAGPVTGSDALRAEVALDVGWGCVHGDHDTTPSERHGIRIKPQFGSVVRPVFRA